MGTVEPLDEAGPTEDETSVISLLPDGPDEDVRDLR